MRLIDADKLHPDSMTNKGTVAISQSQIANAKTVEAISLSVIKKITTEIEERATYEGIYLDRADVLAIIDKAVKEIKHEQTCICGNG